jgi:hypothetical protein
MRKKKKKGKKNKDKKDKEEGFKEDNQFFIPYLD